MKRFYTFLASLLLIVACSDTNSSTYTEADAVEFLERIEKEDETIGPIASSAYWIGSNFINCLIHLEKSNIAATSYIN